MRIPKSAIILSALVVGLSVSGVATASAAAPPKAVGVCAKTSGGGLRLLEPGNLAKSRYGACKSSEKKVVLPTVDGIPKAINGKDGRGFDLPFKLVLDNQPARTCTWAAATSTLTCVTPAS